MINHTPWILANAGLLLGVSISLTLSTILCFGGISIPFCISSTLLGVVWSLFVIKYWKTRKSLWFVAGMLGGILSYCFLPKAFSAGNNHAVYSMASLFIMVSIFFLIVSVFKNRIGSLASKQ